MHTPSLDISLRLSVPIDIVWVALTLPRFRSEWWPESSFTPRTGEDISASARRPGKKKLRRASGTITGIDHDAHELHVKWTRSPSGDTTKVHVLLSETKRRCKIRVIEEGFAADGDDAQVTVARSRDGWRDVLAALAAFLDIDEHRSAIERTLADD